jgi:ketosteroid isomerase-like protein
MTMPPGTPIPARLREFLQVWNSHDLDRIAGLFAPDAVVEDELVVIDPDRPAGARLYRGAAEIRSFALLATPGFHAIALEAKEAGDRIFFVASVRADGLRRRGIDVIEQRDELTFEGDRVVRFRIQYPPASHRRLMGHR